jgi:hypothetical protein
MLADSLLGITSALGLVLATNALYVADWPRFFASIIACVVAGTWLLRRILLNAKQPKPVEQFETETVR